MRTPATRRYEELAGMRQVLRSEAVLLSVVLALLSSSLAQAVRTATEFSVVGSLFHQRDPEDAGEARICIHNTGAEPLSMAQLTVRILAGETTGAELPAEECKCVYVKLSPPVLRRGQYGEVVAKLLDRPGRDRRLTCDVSARGAAISHTVPLLEPALWISYVGFSEDLRKVLVYVENTGPEPIAAELLEVGHLDMAGRTRAIHSPVPPQDKGCLVGDLPSPLTAGEFVHVVVGENTGTGESKRYAVTRAIPAIPLIPEGDTGDPRLGLDVQLPFLQTMVCPAHAHGSAEEAAAKFLGDYTQRFSETPGQVIQMAICRSDLPRAWFRFGALPDVAAINPCLRPSSHYDKEPQEGFCLFFRVGELAKRATEPGRYLAIIPMNPGVEEASFLLKGLAPQEWRFLVYCAVASGAKGVIYRSLPVHDPLSRDAFRQLNRELQYLKPLLLMAEPVKWATTAENSPVAESLLCGDQAVLVLVFDHRYFSRHRDGKLYTPPFERTIVPARVTVRVPPGMVVRDVRTPFASLDRGCWEYRNGTLDFTAEMVDSAQVYVASLQAESRPVEGGLTQ